jgi:hypothetical protein
LLVSAGALLEAVVLLCLGGIGEIELATASNATATSVSHKQQTLRTNWTTPL